MSKDFDTLFAQLQADQLKMWAVLGDALDKIIANQEAMVTNLQAQVIELKEIK